MHVNIEEKIRGIQEKDKTREMRGVEIKRQRREKWVKRKGERDKERNE